MIVTYMNPCIFRPVVASVPLQRTRVNSRPAIKPRSCGVCDQLVRRAFTPTTDSSVVLSSPPGSDSPGGGVKIATENVARVPSGRGGLAHVNIVNPAGAFGVFTCLYPLGGLTRYGPTLAYGASWAMRFESGSQRDSFPGSR